MQLPRHNSPISGNGYGYVYVMSYPGSDKVKIGHSLNPTTRAVDIGGTLAPEEPQIEVLYWCSERREAVERKAHQIESERRHNGEWFVMTVTEAVGAIQTAASAVEVEISLVFERDAYEHAERAKRIAEWEAMPFDLLDALPYSEALKHGKVSDRDFGKIVDDFPRKYPEYGEILERKRVLYEQQQALLQQVKLVFSDDEKRELERQRRVKAGEARLRELQDIRNAKLLAEQRLEQQRPRLQRLITQWWRYWQSRKA
jgi:hypothetical protein